MGEYTSAFEKALEELNIGKYASPRDKLRAVCQWHIGDPEWANAVLSWAREAGYKVED